MQILGLLGMYFDAVVVEVKTFLLLFRLALALFTVLSESLKDNTYGCNLDTGHFFHTSLIQCLIF